MIKTGFNELDKLIEGLKEGELITIAGRPAMGKTTLGICIANNISNQKESKMVLYFTLESKADYLKSKRTVDKNVIIVDDIYNIEDIRTESIKLSKQGISLIIIDYIQLISITSLKSNRKIDEAMNIAREIKLLALELNIPIIVISQLSRSLEQRENKRPIIPDLASTGLEQNSDKIICLYSDGYYVSGYHIDIKDIELIVIKNRNLPIGTVKLKYNKDTMEFESITSNI